MGDLGVYDYNYDYYKSIDDPIPGFIVKRGKKRSLVRSISSLLSQTGC